MNMNKLKYLLPGILTVLIFLCGMAIPAQDIRFNASVDPTSVSPGEEFTYSLRIFSDSAKSLPSPNMPEFGDFEIISGPNTSQSFQFINGNMSREMTYSTTLRCLKPGEYTIAPATIKVGGREIKSENVQVRVVKSGSSKVPASLKDENLPSPSSANANLKQYLEGKIFFRTEASKKNPYVGEPFVASYTLYVQKGVPASSVNLAEPLPQFKEFLKEDLYSAKQLNFRDVEIEGKTYQAALIKKIILVPTKTGKIILDPMTLNIGIIVQQNKRRSSHPFFDDPFFSFDPFMRNTERVLVPSSVLELDVKPLPQPQPENFSGTVGDYNLSATLDRKKATTDDLITLTLKLEGSGAVEGALEPKLPSLEGFEVYETKARAEKKITSSDPGGAKVFDYVLRPQKTGDMAIPSIAYCIFNPGKETYETLHTEAIYIPISEGSARAPLIISGTSPSLSGEQVVEINADINYIKRKASFSRNRRLPFILSGWFLTIQGLPILFALIAFIIARRREAMESDQGLARRLRAKGLAGKRLKAASVALKNRDPDSFYAELSMALRGFFGDKLNRKTHGITIEELKQLLEERGIGKEEISSVITVLETADAARYAPTAPLEEEMREHFDVACKIIQQFGKKL